MKIGIIGTYRVLCGAAVHIENLAPILAKDNQIKIFAEFPYMTNELPMKESLKSIDYVRCWRRGEGFQNLTKELLEFKPGIANFSFIAGLFNELEYYPNSEFQQMIHTLKDNNILPVLSLNDIPTQFFDKNRIYEWYKKLGLPYLVYNQDMLDGLKKWFPEADAKVIPIGTRIFIPTNKFVAREKIGIPKKTFLISQVGNFLGADRGIEEIVDQIPKINIPNLLVAFVGGFHPTASPIHKVCVKNSMQKAIKYGITSKVKFTGMLNTEEEIDLWACASDFIIHNHKATFGYGISAAPRRVACAKVPILMGEGTRLSEYINGFHCIKFPDDNHIAGTIMFLYKDKSLQEKIANNLYNYAMSMNYEVMAKNYVKFFEQKLGS